MKLFVWEEFEPNYTAGLAFAIAKNEEQAKELVKKEYGLESIEFGPTAVFSLKEPRAFGICGSD